MSLGTNFSWCTYILQLIYSNRKQNKVDTHLCPHWVACGFNCKIIANIWSTIIFCGNKLTGRRSSQNCRTDLGNGMGMGITDLKAAIISSIAMLSHTRKRCGISPRTSSTSFWMVLSLIKTTSWWESSILWFNFTRSSVWHSINPFLWYRLMKMLGRGRPSRLVSHIRSQ
jgi:hypothetical protein